MISPLGLVIARYSYLVLESVSEAGCCRVTGRNQVEREWAMGRVDGKIASVTGRSRGIGAEIARRFGSEVAAVAVAARTTEPGQSPLDGTIGDTVASIEAAGGTAVAVPADLSKPHDREELVAETTRQ